jgi:hypothetical protein
MSPCCCRRGRRRSPARRKYPVARLNFEDAPNDGKQIYRCVCSSDALTSEWRNKTTFLSWLEVQNIAPRSQKAQHDSRAGEAKGTPNGTIANRRRRAGAKPSSGMVMISGWVYLRSTPGI